MMGWGKREWTGFGALGMFGQGCVVVSCHASLPLFPMGGESRLFEVWGNVVS